MSLPTLKSSSPSQAPVAAIPFTAALLFWLKLGFISFGGPAGQIAIMHRELVEQRRWISEKRFLHALNYCMLLPGPEAQQLATYLGWLMHRTWGGVLAGGLFVLPSLFILIGLSAVYVLWGHTVWVGGLFYGIKPAVAAIVLQAVFRIGGKTLRRRDGQSAPWLLRGIAVFSFVALLGLGLPFPVIVLGAGALGWLGWRWWPDQFTPPAGHAASHAPHVPALIDDDTPPPAHARFSSGRTARVLLCSALLWSLPMGLLVAWQGIQGTLPQMGWFFTKAAWLTFGGAYAVLPYVYQAAVTQFAWLTGPQMMDGLALGETTPGPLIMVVAFVGFLGGWNLQPLGPELPLAGAALAATVVTWFTFLPSFVFILAGGPLVESTHGKLQFTAPLSAIGAAVVGVIGTLAVFFLDHVLLHTGPDNALKPDFVAALLTCVAALALFRLKWSVLRVIGVCALLGLGLAATSMV
jgi:chromate transporter